MVAEQNAGKWSLALRIGHICVPTNVLLPLINHRQIPQGLILSLLDLHISTRGVTDHLDKWLNGPGIREPAKLDR